MKARCWSVVGLIGVASVLGGSVALGVTVLYSPLDCLEGWDVRTSGPGEVRFVAGIGGTECVELRSQGGSVLLSRELPLEEMAGCRVQVSCQVKTDEVVPGPLPAGKAKLHMAVATPGGVRHFSTRFDGSGPWRQEGLVVDVPRDAQRIVLNLGMETCSGRLSLAQLIVRNDRRGVWPLSLENVINARHDQLGLDAFPEGTIEWQGVPFRMPQPKAAGDCLRLGGTGHEDWPRATAAAIPVGRHATAVYLLHAALGSRETAETPSVIWNAALLGGFDTGLSVFEGRQIGPLGSTKDLDNWKVAWRRQDAAGKWITFGVTRWPFYTDSLVKSLSCQTYQGSPIVVLAATVVEEPPPEPASGVDEEIMSEDEE